ncbi:uncharacterized protein Gm40011 isoform X2 [Mus musculus]|uniref:uncharacterized protein Gm40011 isoform X2 n=1 Tax=Mus musculus TaxID=10090 RepID=UPI0005ABA3BF|nr:uncharacterized protein Gm40011 isoform X2 [Mus musculus]|eukprot:XP_011238201.1 PREDICTED: uncharacterized protein Gm40011 isoform X2 [Mus musculus]
MINKRLYFRKPKPHDDKMFQGHSTERHDCSLIHHLSIMLKIISQVTLWKVTRAPSEHQCPHVQSAQGNSAGRERSLSAGPEWVPEEPRDGRRGHSVPVRSLCLTLLCRAHEQDAASFLEPWAWWNLGHRLLENGTDQEMPATHGLCLSERTDGRPHKLLRKLSIFRDSPTPATTERTSYLTFRYFRHGTPRPVR